MASGSTNPISQRNSFYFPIFGGAIDTQIFETALMAPPFSSRATIDLVYSSIFKSVTSWLVHRGTIAERFELFSVRFARQ